MTLPDPAEHGPAEPGPAESGPTRPERVVDAIEARLQADQSDDEPPTDWAPAVPGAAEPPD
jgi:hypothetical protein